MSNELERTGKEAVLAWLRYYRSIYLERLRTIAWSLSLYPMTCMRLKQRPPQLQVQCVTFTLPCLLSAFCHILSLLIPLIITFLHPWKTRRGHEVQQETSCQSISLYLEVEVFILLPHTGRYNVPRKTRGRFAGSVSVVYSPVAVNLHATCP
jgi:hypothetical protein